MVALAAHGAQWLSDVVLERCRFFSDREAFIRITIKLGFVHWNAEGRPLPFICIVMPVLEDTLTDGISFYVTSPWPRHTTGRRTAQQRCRGCSPN